MGSLVGVLLRIQLEQIMDKQQKVDEETELNVTVSEPLEFDDQYQQKPKEVRWGRCIPLVFRKGIPAIVLGPHWPLFLCAYMIFAAVSVFLIQWHMKSESLLVRWTTVAVCLNQCFSYAWVALVNPGVANQEQNLKLPQKSEKSEKKLTAWYCDKCKIIQLMGTVHCYDCDVCVLEMDHHCPWTGKCIGKGNIKQFYYFIGSTLLFMILNIVVSITEIDVKVQ